MNFETFEPIYEAILEDFGFGRRADEQSRDVAAARATPFPISRFDGWVDATVAIVGAAPCLTAELDRVRSADIVVAASTAVDVLSANDIAVDCMVTDLDKNPETAAARTDAGLPVVAHAHGDNVLAVREWLSRFDSDHTMVTTQAAPVGAVQNVGGFTDGDRAAFLADHVGAGRLTFPGWAFDDPAVGPMKARKLEWAAMLLGWLEQRRNQQFDVLDDRRTRVRRAFDAHVS